MILRSARLVLRPARPEDLEDMHAVLSHPAAMRYWSTPEHQTIAQTRAWLAGMIDAPPDRAEDFVVEYAGRVIGKCGAWRLPEVGFILHPDHWRRGLGFEALRIVVDHLFATRPLEKLTAEADPRNSASLRLMHRIGFVETHRARNTMQWGDEWCDSVYLALDRSRWRA